METSKAEHATISPFLLYYHVHTLKKYLIKIVSIFALVVVTNIRRHVCLRLKTLFEYVTSQ